MTKVVFNLDPSKLDLEENILNWISEGIWSNFYTFFKDLRYYNSLTWITSKLRTQLVLCLLILYMRGVTLLFKVDSERKNFEKLFHRNFIYPLSLARSLPLTRSLSLLHSLSRSLYLSFSLSLSLSVSVILGL